MYIESLDLDINNISKYTREDIKNIYKKIALDCHPDKLCNIKDVNVKNIKIEKFKKASIGYKKALDEFDKYGKLVCDSGNIHYTTNDIYENFDMYKDIDVDFWNNVYNEFFYDKESIQKTFVDVAKLFFKNGFNKKDYYNPSTKVIKHDITLPISYYDLYNTKKKRVQILLKGVDEPFNISILCKKVYPCLTRQYIDDNGIEHEIKINMMISNIDSESESDIENHTEEDTSVCNKINESKIKNNIYTHKIKNNIIDLITDIDINLKDYLIGSIKVIKYIDDSYIDIIIHPFNMNNIVIKNKGLIGGDLIIKLIFHNISKNNWDKIKDDNKKNFIKYLDDIFI